jgi:hypothetical protein
MTGPRPRVYGKRTSPQPRLTVPALQAIHPHLRSQT